LALSNVIFEVRDVSRVILDRRLLRITLWRPAWVQVFSSGKAGLAGTAGKCPAGIGGDSLLMLLLNDGNIFLIYGLSHTLQVTEEMSEAESTLSNLFPHLLQENP